ncbi:MAG: nuclear transport factor 2 family protein [Rhodocyclaceae bacterium]|nr:nuclear transport factor 2 family protein [Rhodocyclaceae bacterium]
MSPRLNRLIVFYESMTPESVGEIARLYRSDARFRDPFNDVCGVQAIQRIFIDLFARTDGARFIVLEDYENGSRAALSWRLEFRFRRGGEAVAIEGMSRLLFDRDGRVACHHDHWDATGQLLARLPLLAWPIGWLRRRLAA